MAPLEEVWMRDRRDGHRVMQSASSLRTRVSHLGGSIDAGVHEGGWMVRTRLPLTMKRDDG